MTNKLMPWEQLPDVWKTKAAYFQWLRGQMRKAWSRHPVKIAYAQSRRVKAPVGKQIDKSSGKPKLVWALPCDQCGGSFPQSNVEVDHIVRAGSFKSWEDCEQWLMGLMQINFAGLQLLCKPCHRIKSYAETHSLSFEDAAAEKAAIAWMKESTPKYQALFLTEYTDASAADLSTIKKRRAAYVQYYKSVGGKVAG